MKTFLIFSLFFLQHIVTPAQDTKSILEFSFLQKTPNPLTNEIMSSERTTNVLSNFDTYTVFKNTRKIAELKLPLEMLPEGFDTSQFDRIKEVLVNQRKKDAEVEKQIFFHFNFDTKVQQSHLWDYEKREFFDIVDSLDNFGWVLKDSFKIINKLPCQKAEGQLHGEYYFAWFTTSIPVPCGPGKFNGLPGLILKVDKQIGDESFEVTDISFPAKNSVDLSTYRLTDRKITYSEYIKSQNTTMKNILIQQRTQQ